MGYPHRWYCRLRTLDAKTSILLENRAENLLERFVLSCPTSKLLLQNIESVGANLFATFCLDAKLGLGVPRESRINLLLQFSYPFF